MGALAGRPYGQIGELVTRFAVERERVPVPGASWTRCWRGWAWRPARPPSIDRQYETFSAGRVDSASGRTR